MALTLLVLVFVEDTHCLISQEIVCKCFPLCFSMFQNVAQCFQAFSVLNTNLNKLKCILLNGKQNELSSDESNNREYFAVECRLLEQKRSHLINI